MIQTFQQLNLNPNLVSGLEKAGITTPTEIQERIIPLALSNSDVIGESETGSGKTLAYLLPLFEKIDTSKRIMQAFILAPTHELVMQIGKEINLLAQNSGINVTSTTIIGDVNVKRQVEKLKEKPHIIVGTSARILQLIGMKKINAQTVKTIVIDECDKLFDKDNLSGVKDVIKSTQKDRQLMIFSATVNEKTIGIAKDIMKEPALVKIHKTNEIAENITHMYFLSEQRDKVEILRKLIASITPEKAIIFINKSQEVEILTSKLKYHHISAVSIYGTATKEERKMAMEQLRNGKVQLLIASDIAARGLDIKNVTHIFNMDLPGEPKEYLHRVGRTGRAGKSGTAISIVTERESAFLKKYEKMFNISIEKREIYKGKIVVEAKKQTKYKKI